MTQITYSNKSDINTTATPNVNKVLASDLNEIKSVVNQNDTLLSNITGNILWTNPNPTSDFSSQTITLSSDDYDVLEFFYGYDTSGVRVVSERTIKGNGVQFDVYSTVVPTRAWRRKAEFVSNTSYSVGNCTRMEYNQTAYNENGYCVPLYVVGYKTGLF